MASRKQRKEKKRSMQSKIKSIVENFTYLFGKPVSPVTNKRTHCIVVDHAPLKFHCDQKIVDPILNTFPDEPK